MEKKGFAIPDSLTGKESAALGAACKGFEAADVCKRLRQKASGNSIGARGKFNAAYLHFPPANLSCREGTFALRGAGMFLFRFRFDTESGTRKQNCSSNT